VRGARIHITGASGCGVTTLGHAVADALGVAHHDVDDYFWCPTDPPYLQNRPVPERLRLMREMFVPLQSWVLSGSVGSWGNELVERFGLVVFLRVPTEIRLARLRDREARRGILDEDFIEWASHYDDGTREGRSLPRHEAWLKSLQCPVLRLDGTRPVAELAARVVEAIQRSNPPK
jgi:adenylate kinase family enzyme